MSDRFGTLGEEYVQYFGNIKQGIVIAGGIIYGTVKLLFDTSAFVLSCGKRRPRRAAGLELHRSSSELSSDSNSSPRRANW
jgi:hypothetical protein